MKTQERETLEKIGTILQRIRENRGMSVTDVSNSTALMRYKDIEAGKMDIRLTTFIRILQSLEAQISITEKEDELGGE